MKKALFSLALTVLSMGLALAQAGYKVGDKAIDFKLKNIDGRMLSLKEYPNTQGFIVVFTCNHCPYAKAYEQRIMNLDRKFAPSGYPVIAINPNDPADNPEDSYQNMQARSKKMKYSFPYLLDETQEVAKAYGAVKTPHVFILKKDGNDFTVEYIGAIDDNDQNAAQVKEKYVEKAISELMAGQKVSNNSTKAIGCSIKWKKA